MESKNFNTYYLQCKGYLAKINVSAVLSSENIKDIETSVLDFIPYDSVLDNDYEYMVDVFQSTVPAIKHMPRFLPPDWLIAVLPHRGFEAISSNGCIVYLDGPLLLYERIILQDKMTSMRAEFPRVGEAFSGRIFEKHFRVNVLLALNDFRKKNILSKILDIVEVCEYHEISVFNWRVCLNMPYSFLENQIYKDFIENLSTKQNYSTREQAIQHIQKHLIDPNKHITPFIEISGAYLASDVQ